MKNFPWNDSSDPDFPKKPGTSEHFHAVLSGLIRETGEAVLNGDSVEGALNRLASRLMPLFHADACLFASVDFSRNDILSRACCGLNEVEQETEIRYWKNHLVEFYTEGCVPDGGNSHSERMEMCFWVPLDLNEVNKLVLLFYYSNQFSIDINQFIKLRSMLEQQGVGLKTALLYHRYLDAFHLVSASIHSGVGVDDILALVVRHATEIMGAKGSIYWILNQNKQLIEKKLVFGFPYNSLASVGFSDLAAIFKPDSHGFVRIDDARYDNRIPNLERLGKKKVVSIIGIPLEIVDEYHGILAVYFSRPWKAVHRELHFLKSLAEQGAIALHRALRYDRHLLETFRQTISGLSLAIEARDDLTHGHSLKVACYARMTAREMGLSERETETIYHAGLLHDIGKIGIRDHHLDKLGALNRREMELVKKHPEIGAGILKPLPFLNEIAVLVLYHHERFDGSGYPEGLRGADIPLGARVLGTCDSFETMISGRHLIRPRSLESAVDRLQEASGKLFDPDVVAALISAVRKHPDQVCSFRSVPSLGEPDSDLQMFFRTFPHIL